MIYSNQDEFRKSLKFCIISNWIMNKKSNLTEYIHGDFKTNE